MTHQENWESTLKWLDEVARDAERYARSLTGLDGKVEAHRCEQELGLIRRKLRAQIFAIEDLSKWREATGPPVHCDSCNSEINEEECNNATVSASDKPVTNPWLPRGSVTERKIVQDELLREDNGLSRYPVSYAQIDPSLCPITAQAFRNCGYIEIQYRWLHIPSGHTELETLWVSKKCHVKILVEFWNRVGGDSWEYSVVA